MNFEKTDIDGLLIITPDVFPDDRGYFYETPGIITSLTYTIPNDSPWEIGPPSDNKGIEAYQ